MEIKKMLAEITVQQETIIAVVSFLITILGYLWGFARLVAKLELKPDHKEVEEMIDKRYENHCPYSDRLEVIEKEVRGMIKWKDDRIELLHRVEKELQQVRLNTEMICDSLDIKYKQ